MIDQTMIEIIRNLQLTPEQAEEQIRNYTNTKKVQAINALKAALPAPVVSIETTNE